MQQHDPPNPDSLHDRMRENADTGRALAKDAAQTLGHARALVEQSARACQEARRLRACVPTDAPADGLYTVPQACALLGVAERTLRVALRDPAVAPRVSFESRKIGTFYKYVHLLPAELIDDLRSRFPRKQP